MSGSYSRLIRFPGHFNDLEASLIVGFLLIAFSRGSLGKEQCPCRPGSKQVWPELSDLAGLHGEKGADGAKLRRRLFRVRVEMCAKSAKEKWHERCCQKN
jgi:hypothetical protein